MKEEVVESKECATCHVEKPITEYNTGRATCKECVKPKHKEYYLI